MRGLVLVRVALVAVVAVLAGFVLVGRPSDARLAVAITSPSPSLLPEASPLPASAAWDLDADIGSVMVFSWRGALDWSAVKPVVAHNQIGGVLLFTPNFQVSLAARIFGDETKQVVITTTQTKRAMLVRCIKELRLRKSLVGLAQPQSRSLWLSADESHAREINARRSHCKLGSR